MDADPGLERLPAEPRQRWRLTFHRGPDAPPIPHREVAELWIAALAATLPLPRFEGARPRSPLAFAAPLPVGMVVERELADLYLAERLPGWRVRACAAEGAPAGIAIDDAHDVWLGVPPIAAAVAAADYRVILTAASDPGAERLRRAARELLAAPSLERRRPRGSDSVTYDLRPLVAWIDVDGERPAVVRIRTLFHPERGTGRPEEVIAALGAVLGATLDVTATIRERVLLADEILAPA